MCQSSNNRETVLAATRQEPTISSHKRALEDQDPTVESPTKWAKFTHFEEADKKYRGKLINTAVLFLQLQEHVRRTVEERHARDEKERAISLELAKQFPMEVEDEDEGENSLVQDESDRLSLKVESTMSPSEEAAIGVKFEGREVAKDVDGKGGLAEPVDAKKLARGLESEEMLGAQPLVC